MKTEWISVEERLPDFESPVLVFRKRSTLPPWKTIMMDRFVIVSDANFRSYWNTFDDVTHWQPLPEPPKQ
jgi:hypothetical protein